MIKVSRIDNIEIRKFTNGKMTELIVQNIGNSPAKGLSFARDYLYDTFGEIPVYGKTNNSDNVMSFLRKFVEDVTGIKLPEIDSKEKYFHIGPVATIFQEGVLKDKGQGDGYSVVIHPKRYH